MKIMNTTFHVNVVSIECGMKPTSKEFILKIIELLKTTIYTSPDIYIKPIDEGFIPHSWGLRVVQKWFQPL
jgi:hypothetical protein